MASAAVPARTPPPALTGSRMWLAGLVLAIANFMVVLDTAIANVSVPHIAGSLAISPDQGTWVITSYAVAEAICVPLTGWLAARFGTVRAYMVCMTGFCLFSILCGLSVSLGMLVAARVGQGFCGGPLMPLTQTLLMRVFPAEKRGQAMGLWAMTTVVAPIAGPLLGGTISDTWSWHWIFFINVPFAVICLTGIWFMVRQVETPTERRPIDYVGLALLVLWIGALQVMLDLGRDRDWFASPFILTLGVVAAVGFVAFLIWELTEPEPIVDLRVFRHRGFSATVAALAITFGAYFAGVVVTPQWLQGAMGYTATYAGYVVAWSGLLAVVMSPIVGRISGKFDARLLVSFGILWIAFATYLRSLWTSSADYWTLALPHLVNGFGMPFFFVPLTILSLSSVDPKEVASAAGLSSFVRTLSGAVATAIATTVWVNNQQRGHAELAEIVHPDAAVRTALENRGLGEEALRNLLSRLVDQESVALATVHLFQGAAVLLVFAAMLIWIVPKPKRVVQGGGGGH